MSMSSRSTWAASDRSTTLTTSTSLFNCLVICSSTSSDPGSGWSSARGDLPWRHGEGFDIVAAGGEQSGYPGQGAGFVFDQNGNDVSHGVVPPITQVFCQNHFGQALAGRHHGKDVGGWIDDEVHED